MSVSFGTSSISDNTIRDLKRFFFFLERTVIMLLPLGRMILYVSLGLTLREPLPTSVLSSSRE